MYGMEKVMAIHSSTLAWKIPWMEKPGSLQSMGSLRVRHDWATSLSLFTFMHWRRKWQATPVLLPGESQGRGSLVGCRLWDRRVGHDWSDLAAAAAERQSHVWATWKHLKVLRAESELDGEKESWTSEWKAETTNSVPLSLFKLSMAKNHSQNCGKIPYRGLVTPPKF